MRPPFLPQKKQVFPTAKNALALGHWVWPPIEITKVVAEEGPGEKLQWLWENSFISIRAIYFPWLCLITRGYIILYIYIHIVIWSYRVYIVKSSVDMLKYIVS